MFDAVILSNTIQATEKPRVVLEHLLRIGRRTAVSLPNFGYWKVRLSLLTGGRMPRTKDLDYSWFDTPNIHLCTLADFLDLTRLRRDDGGSPCPERKGRDAADAARRLMQGYLAAPTCWRRARSFC